MSISAKAPETETLRTARAYAARCWSVVPVRPGDKLPAVEWARFQRELANDSQLVDWFETGGYGIGLVQGRVADTIVLDFDGEAGMETRARLEAEHGALPLTVEALTPGGGCHVMVMHPGRYVPTRRNLLPGTDVRGDGGFIVVHPSLHANGRRYEWDIDHHPEDVEVAPCPSWVADLVCGNPPGGQANSEPVVQTMRPGTLGMPEPVIADGRETYMRDTVLAVLSELNEALGALPTIDRLFEAAWAQYSRKVDFTRAGRGADEVRAKCRYTLARVHAGIVKLRPREPKAASSFVPDIEPTKPESQEEIFPTLDIQGLLALPPVEWLISGILTTDGFSVPYGPPGSLKTFVVLDWSLCICSGLPWHGKSVKQGTVLYVAAEGVRGIARRVRAWQIKRNLDGVDLPFRLLPASVDMTQPAEVAKLVRTAVAAARTEGCPIALVVIDTVARAIPGADENSAQDMGRFVAAVETVKAGVTCHVLGVHHSGKDEDRGARGSNSLLGAVDTMIRVKRDGDNLTLTVEKQKDEDEGEPIELRIEKVEWLEGLRQSGSLVLVPNTDKNPRMAEVDLVMVATVIGPNGRMTTRKLGEALGAKAGRQTYEMANSIPFYPDYARVDLPEGAVKVFRARTGKMSNSPIDVVRSDQEA